MPSQGPFQTESFRDFTALAPALKERQRHTGAFQELSEKWSSARISTFYSAVLLILARQWIKNIAMNKKIAVD